MNLLKDVYEAVNSWAQTKPISYYNTKSSESTNDVAKSEAFDTDDTFKLYYCSSQTKGRGRGNAEWLQAKPGSQLFSSWSFSLVAAPQPISAPLFGLATYEAFKSVWPKTQFSMKAPNDIYIKDKKVAGILVETVTQASQFRIIIGLGLNILDHPREVEHATHLATHVTDFISQKQIQELMDQIYTQYSKAILLCQQDELELADRLLIKKALNLCPVYDEEVLDVSPQGDIIFESSKLEWFHI